MGQIYRIGPVNAMFIAAGGTVINSGSIISRGVAGSNQDGISVFGASNLTISGSISAAVNAVVAFDSLLAVKMPCPKMVASPRSI